MWRRIPTTPSLFSSDPVRREVSHSEELSPREGFLSQHYNPGGLLLSPVLASAAMAAVWRREEASEYYRNFERAADADLDIVDKKRLAAKKQAEANAKKVRRKARQS